LTTVIRAFVLLVILVVIIVDSNDITFPRNGRDGRDGLTITGPAGRDGRDGTDGQDCIECSKGPLGPKGSNGISGKNGKDGIPGKQGIQGNIGPQGMKGDKGDSGVIGTKGDKGVCDIKILDKILKDLLAAQNELRLMKQKVSTLENTVVTLNGKNEKLEKVLDIASNKIKQSYLPAGYDKYSLYDIQWQSLHMAAAAACRGSTPTGGSGPIANYVYAKKDGVTCTATCLQTTTKNCDAAVSINGYVDKSTKILKAVGAYYNYGCAYAVGYPPGVEEKMKNEQISSVTYISYCCCRK